MKHNNSNNNHFALALLPHSPLPANHTNTRNRETSVCVVANKKTKKQKTKWWTVRAPPQTPSPLCPPLRCHLQPAGIHGSCPHRLPWPHRGVVARTCFVVVYFRVVILVPMIHSTSSLLFFPPPCVVCGGVFNSGKVLCVIESNTAIQR